MELRELEISGKSVDEAVFNGLSELGATLDEVHIEIIKEETKGVLGFGARQALVKLTMRDPEELKALYEDSAQSDEEHAEHAAPRAHHGEAHSRRESHEDKPRREGRGGSQGRRDSSRGRDGGRDRSRPREQFVDDDPLYGVPSDNPAALFLSGMLERMGVNSMLAVRDEEDALRIKIKCDSMGILIGHRGETLDSLQYLSSLVLNKGRKEYRRLTLDTENYRVKREETLTRLAARLAEQVATSGRSISLEPMNPYERRVMHSSLQDNEAVFTFSEGEEPNRNVVIAPKQ